MKAIQTGSESWLFIMCIMRQAFPSSKVETQSAFERMIDVWLTANGIEDRIARVREAIRR